MQTQEDPLRIGSIACLFLMAHIGALSLPLGPLARADDDPKPHWAFVPPVRHEMPNVKHPEWARNPIDRFVLAKLEKEGLTPSPEADRITLLRRLSLDQIGLPPTISEVDAFVKDPSDNAYEKVVQRLLNSPHYGEKWGRHWLDAARYADSDGFEKDKSRQVWFYRDWVINSLNRDLPYNQFIIEQIAGDLLPNATQDQTVATGYLRNSMINEEGGIDPEQFRMEAMFDRMDAIGKGILGLTIQCAQCHNHKYDPLKQKEYYELFAFLNSAHEANVAVYTPVEQMRRAEIFRRIHQIEADLQHRHSDWPERDWTDGLDCRPPHGGGGIHGRPKIFALGGRLLSRPRLRTDQAHGQNASENRRQRHHRFSAGAADRSESPFGRSRPIDLRHGCIDGIQSGSGAGQRTQENPKDKDRQGDGRLQFSGKGPRLNLRRQERQTTGDRTHQLRHRREE